MLKIENLALSYAHDHASRSSETEYKQSVLKDVSFELKQGEIGCIVGPSGCGKTSLIRAIAGFNPIDAGRISISNKLVSSSELNIEVGLRKIGVVFQDFALFPHFSVLQNVLYGLDALPKDQAKSLALAFIEMVGLSEHANKLPHQLSGGQQQRVAIARALAPKPDLILLDEPFSSLDPELRTDLVQEVASLIRKNGTTALLITHDQNEAFTMADKIGVLNKGHCEQWASPQALYHEPKTAFVANFIGEGSFIDAHLVCDSSSVRLNCALGELDATDAQLNTKTQTGKILIRPDDIIHDDSSSLHAKVIAKVFRGAQIFYTLLLEQSGENVFCLAPSHHDHLVGESFGIRLELQHLVFFCDD